MGVSASHRRRGISFGRPRPMRPAPAPVFPEMVEPRPDGMPYECRPPNLFLDGKSVHGHTARDGNGLYVVPYDYTPFAAAVRAHESGHLKWSPSSTEASCLPLGADKATIGAMEDGRINNLLTMHECADLSPMWERIQKGADRTLERASKIPDGLPGSLTHSGYINMVLLVGYAHLGCAPSIGAILEFWQRMKLPDKAIGDIGYNVLCHLQAGVSQDRYVYFEQAYRMHRDYIKTLQAIEDIPGSGFDVTTQQFLQQLQERAGTYGRMNWGRLIHEREHCTVPVFSRLQRSVTYRPTDRGAIFRNPSRYCTDGRIFANRRSTPGGTVLLDLSGSMSVSAADIAALVLAAPAVLIAGYGGDESTGTMRIYARNGRRVPDSECRRPTSGGNVVDGPAVDWLVQQPAPRMWVTDGGFTGVGDSSATPAMHLHCLNQIIAGTVTCVPSITQARELFGCPKPASEPESDDE